MAGGGLFFDFGAVRTASMLRAGDLDPGAVFEERLFAPRYLRGRFRYGQGSNYHGGSEHRAGLQPRRRAKKAGQGRGRGVSFGGG